MNLKISDLYNAIKNNSDYDNVITIYGDDYDKPYFVSTNQHCFFINDILIGNNAPNKETLLKILDLWQSIKNTNVLIHCFAGISRSPAIALMLLIDSFGKENYKQAYEYLIKINPKSNPNKKIVELTDEIFGLNGNLISLVNKPRKIDLRDYNE